MEFNPHFAIIQSVLKTQDKLHGGLQNIQSGNESKVIVIKNKLLEVLEEESLNKDGLRSVYLLLLLNTDHDCFDSLFQDSNCVHILGSIPKLSKYLFIEIVDHLKLNEFVQESILFLPTFFSIEVVEIYFLLLKKRDPFQLLKYVDFISCSIFKKLVLLENSADSFNSKLKYFELLQLAIENFSSTKMNDYKSWEQNKLCFFTACIMKALASIVKTCCKYYIQPVINKENHLDIYDLDIKKEFNKEVKIQLDIKEENLLQYCIQLILSKFLTTAQSVTILIWMSWLELEEYTDENLQSVVGNEVYYCLNFINDEKIKNCINSHLYTQLITVLTNLSIKPTNEDDEIKLADIPQILSSINDPARNRGKWLSALINHENFLPDLDSLNLIKENVNFFNQKDCEVFLFKCVEFLKKFSNDGEISEYDKTKNLCKRCVLDSLKNFHADNQIVLLEFFIKKYGITDLLKLPDFDSQLTEVFNKVIDQEHQTIEFYSDFIGVAFQSPEIVIKKTLKEALSSMKHGKLMVDLLKVLKPICIFKTEDMKTNILYINISEMSTKIEALSDSEKDNFVALVTKLIKKSLINGNEFLVCVLMPQLHDSIQNKKWSLVIFLLDVLKCYTDGSLTSCEEELDSKLPILVVLLGQLMDKTRCTLSNYDALTSAVCDKSLEVLISVMELFDGDTQKIAAMNWLEQELRKLNVITQLHVFSYIRTYLSSDCINKASIEIFWLELIISGIETDISFLYDMRRDSFLRTLTKILPGFTSREWRIMFTNLVPKEEAKSLQALLIAAADAVLLLSTMVNLHKNEESDSNENGVNNESVTSERSKSNAASLSTTSCLCFIVKNLIMVVQDVILPNIKNMSEEQVAELFIKVCEVLHTVPQAAQNYSSWILLKVLQDLISSAQLKKIENATDSNAIEINKFCVAIGLITNIDLRQNLSKAIMTSIKCIETEV